MCTTLCLMVCVCYINYVNVPLYAYGSHLTIACHIIVNAIVSEIFFQCTEVLRQHLVTNYVTHQSRAL